MKKFQHKVLHLLLLVLIKILKYTPLLAQKDIYDSLRYEILRSQNEKVILSNYILLTGKTANSSFTETLRLINAGMHLAIHRNDSLSIAMLNRNTGIAYFISGSYDKATFYFYESLNYFERKKDAANIALVLTDIAKVYRASYNLKKSLSFYEKALAIFVSLKDTSGIHLVYNETGLIYKLTGNYRAAAKKFDDALILAQKINDTTGITWYLSNIATIQMLQNKFENAERLFVKSIQLSIIEKDSFALAHIYLNMANLFVQWGKYDKANRYFEMCSSLANKNGYIELLSNCYADMSKMHNINGDYKSALDFYVLYTQIKDSANSIIKSRYIDEINTIYETSKREKQIQDQQDTIRKRNLLLIGTGVLAFMILLISFLLYNRYKWKQDAKLQREILAQQELAAKSIIEAEEKERSRIAKDLHDGVGQMMSVARMNLSAFSNTIHLSDNTQQQSLSNIMKLVDDSCKEVRAVSHSMMPQTLLKKGLPQAIEELVSKIIPEVLNISFHAEGFQQRPDGNTETILYRVIQECINNTLKHAAATQLDIALIKEKKQISITLEDNGKGFVLNEQLQEEGMGLKNLYSRIRFLKGELDIDTAPGRGTSIVIHVPLQTSES